MAPHGLRGRFAAGGSGGRFGGRGIRRRWPGPGRRSQLAIRLRNVSASAESTVRSQRTLTVIQAAAYQQWADSSGGQPFGGVTGPFARFDRADTATKAWS